MRLMAYRGLKGDSGLYRSYRYAIQCTGIVMGYYKYFLTGG